MLVYHPAFDIYNCIFRMLQLLTYCKDEEIAFDKLRIWDFYLTFPSQVREITFPADLRLLKEKVFKDKTNPYEELSDPKGVFDRMQTYQLSAIKCLASYGFVDSKILTKNIVRKTGKQIPEELQGIEFEFKYDIASLFDYYNFINVTKFAQVAGLNASLLRQYKSGNQYISENQVMKVEEALHKIAKEFTEIKLR